MKQIWMLGWVLGGWLVCLTTAHADITQYGDFLGLTVDFQDVTEITSETGQFFGGPTVDEDALNFATTLTGGSQLTSISTSGGFDFSSGALSLAVEARAGERIRGIRIRHYGSLSTMGDNSLAMASSMGFVTAGSDVFNGSFLVQASGNQPGTAFDESYTILLPDVERAVVSVQDQLFTQAAEGPGFAFVNTQGVILETLSVTAIPEPAGGMAIAGLALLVGIRRRRSPTGRSVRS